MGLNLSVCAHCGGDIVELQDSEGLLWYHIRGGYSHCDMNDIGFCVEFGKFGILDVRARSCGHHRAEPVTAGIEIEP